jgi:hypothetical protein
MSIDRGRLSIDSPPSGVRSIVGKSLYIAAGVLLIVHGIAHAVLAYRGSDLVSVLGLRVLFGGACSIAVVGFVLAGIGLAGARPYERPWRGRALAMLAVIASVLAFVLAWVPELWPGLLLDGAIAIALASSSESASNATRRDRSVLRRVSTIT